MMMRRVLFLLCLVLWLPNVALAAYSSLFVFGDSLSDGGNAYALSGGVWPPSPPYDQRFTNGPTAAEVLAAELGISGFAPSTAGGTNYAVGGATTGIGNYNFAVNSPAGLPAAIEFTGMQSQFAAFAASETLFDPTQSLFMVWGGPNDIFLGQAAGDDLSAVAATAITNIAGMVVGLAMLGATDFLVPNLPNLALTPVGYGLGQIDPEAQAGLAMLSAAFNAGLAAALDGVRSAFGASLNIVEFDVAGFLGGVSSDPAGFGFQNVTDPCLALASCEGYLFFDAVHPTAQAHALLGRAFALAVPEPGTSALIVLALIALLLTRHRRATPQTVS